MIRLKTIMGCLLSLFLFSTETVFAQGTGVVTNVAGTDITIELKEGTVKTNDVVRLIHVSGSGMEIEAGTWQVTAVSDKVVKAIVSKKRVTPRKGMKAFFSAGVEKTTSSTPQPLVKPNPSPATNKTENKIKETSVSPSSKSISLLNQTYTPSNNPTDPKTQDDLGWKYQKGNGVKKDLKMAVYWYQKSAEQGYANGQNNLGWMYQNGLGVKKDLVLAASSYRKAAEQGHATAQDNMAWMYQYGLGVTQDYKIAKDWLEKAADKGHPNAINGLGYAYQNGRGVQKDYSTAAVWYRKAAELGHASAQSNLAFLYLNGNGLSQDRNAAIQWFKKSAKNNNKIARDWLTQQKIPW
jgi:hypothetical protein